ncbi:MAG: molecular chaperone HtpG [Alphaproteobacteria bacterium]
MSEQNLLSKPFEAEVSKLLELMIHSVYSEAEVFLRELIANASDACDKLRYLQQTDESFQKFGQDFSVDIFVDKEKKTIVIRDNGIGMTLEDMSENLGTIARSGTQAFAAMLEAKGGESSSIGQFGVGFYSAFIVAQRVEVLSKAAGQDGIALWTSDGASGFQVGVVTKDQFASSHGTEITLHIRDEHEEFLEISRLRQVVTKYAEHIAIPVRLAEMKENEDSDLETITGNKAIWTRNKSEISDEDYQDFYRGMTHHFDKPSHTIHYHAEGRMDYSVLLFIPEEAPYDLFNGERESQVKLHVKKVFITDKAQIIPGYLRFVKGLVDCADLPLNISREMLQNSPPVVSLRKAVTNRVLTELNKLADKQTETYDKIFENFGAVIKEGLYEDHDRRDDLLDLVRFKTTTSGDAWRSLKQIKENMREGQSQIYYITGRNPKEIEASPHLEGFNKRNVEVLILSDPIDDFWVNMIHEYEGTPLSSVTRSGNDLASIVGDKDEQQNNHSSNEGKPSAVQQETLMSAMRLILKDDIADVKLSDRLTDSPVCLVADSQGIDLNLEKILAAQGQSVHARKILELNPDHPYIQKLAANSDDKDFANAMEGPSRLLLDLARIMDGDTPSRPREFVQSITALMQKA